MVSAEVRLVEPSSQHVWIGVVEDSDEDYAALARVARRHAANIELERWTRAEALLEATRAQPPRSTWPDLLLIDLSLPGMSGIELVAELRAQIVTRPLPLFVLSGSSRPRDIDRCYQAGASLYLNKPLSAKHITAAIELLTAGPAWRRRQVDNPG